MANGRAHLLVGAGVGLAIALADNGKRHHVSHHPVTAIGMGAFFGKLPDILEPAHHPHHRQFCHSLIVVGGVLYAMKRAYEWTPDDPWEKFFRGLCLVGGAAYLSHLAMDACTSRSLPVIGKI